VSAADRIEVMEAEARYARERYDLYQAKMYGQRPTTMSRLRELERIHQGAEARLRAAKLKCVAPPPGRSSAGQYGAGGD
jgi:hypothetical protein